MKKTIFIFLFICSSLFIFAERLSSNAEQSASFPLPSIPAELTIPSQRADYLFNHYWEKFDFNNTRHIEPANLEQGFVDFLSIIPHVSGNTVIRDGFVAMLKPAASNTRLFKSLIKLAEQYLDTPDSPMYNETVYTLFLQSMLEIPEMKEVEKLRIADKLESLSKNPVGSKTTNFSFKTIDGQSGDLYSFLAKCGKDAILIFFDPECETCEETMKAMRSNEKLGEMTSEGTKVIAIYPGDNVEAWQVKGAGLPSSWTVGINLNEIEDEELYYLPSMPTIYLIDGDGTVLDRNVRF